MGGAISRLLVLGPVRKQLDQDMVKPVSNITSSFRELGKYWDHVMKPPFSEITVPLSSA